MLSLAIFSEESRSSVIATDNWSCHRGGVQTNGKPIALDGGGNGSIFILGNSLVRLAQRRKSADTIALIE